MLDDAVGAYLDAVPERAFDEPFMAMLRAEGFDRIRLTHGQSEFGKDFVARLERKQWAFQSKAGDIGQRDWGQMTGQLDELRLSQYVGPDFDLQLPRVPVLVTTGRLVGNAPLLAAEYNRRANERGEPPLVIWNRDELVSRLSGSPDAVLRGVIDGALMGILGAIAGGGISMDDVRDFSERWDNYTSDQITSLGVIEASIVCSELARSQRVDLACHLALCLVRAAWSNNRPTAQAVLVADAGSQIFDVHAKGLWTSAEDADLLLKRGVLKECGMSAWLSYSVRCARLAELLGLFAIRLLQNKDSQGSEIASWLAKFVFRQPGVGHLLGDRYAVSLIPPVLAMQNSRAAKKLLTQTAIWICDRYEKPAAGLAWVGASPSEEVDRLFGYPFEHITLRGRRSQSHAAAITLDLASLGRHRKLYRDLRNDYLAVGIDLTVLRCRDSPDQYSLRGEENRWEINPSYPDKLPQSRPLDLPHHRECTNSRQLLSLQRPWDLLAVSSALRDRHLVGAIAAVHKELQNEAN